MAVFRCESCGAPLDFTEGFRILYCPYCGTKQTLPEESVHSLNEAAKISTTLQRGFMLLEEGAFRKAGRYFDRVLDADPANGRAYLGRLMAVAEASNHVELAEILRDGRDNLEAWKNIDAVNSLLAKTLEFAPDEMRDVFSTDFYDASALMKRGKYKEALAAFWRLKNYHPDAAVKAEECCKHLNTTTDDVLSKELEDAEKASAMMLQAGNRALDLSLENFSGKYSDAEGLETVRREIREILDMYYEAFGVLGQVRIIPMYRQFMKNDYRDFAFNAEQLTVYLQPSFIDYVDASESEKRKFLDDVHAMLDEACKYIEAHDKYNPSGSQYAKFREDLRSELDEYEASRIVQSSAIEESSANQQESEVRNTKSISKWLLYILLALPLAFIIYVLLGLWTA